MNVDKLLQVKEMILAEPLRIDMGTFINHPDMISFTKRQRYPACKTVGCIAGWTLISDVLGNDPKENNLLADEDANTIESKAAIALDLSEDEAASLFYPMTYWPDDLYMELNRLTPQTPEYAQVVAKAIDIFIANNGSWPK